MNCTYTHDTRKYRLIDAPDGLLERIDSARLDEAERQFVFLLTDGSTLRVAYEQARKGFRQGIRRSMRRAK